MQSKEEHLQIARSTTEAGYVILRYATQEATWLRRLLKDLNNEIQDEASINFEDNHRAIKISKNPKFHDHTKHIDVA